MIMVFYKLAVYCLRRKAGGRCLARLIDICGVFTCLIFEQINWDFCLNSLLPVESI